MLAALQPLTTTSVQEWEHYLAQSQPFVEHDTKKAGKKYPGCCRARRWPTAIFKFSSHQAAFPCYEPRPQLRNLAGTCETGRNPLDRATLVQKGAGEMNAKGRPLKHLHANIYKPSCARA